MINIFLYCTPLYAIINKSYTLLKWSGFLAHPVDNTILSLFVIWTIKTKENNPGAWQPLGPTAMRGWIPPRGGWGDVFLTNVSKCSRPAAFSAYSECPRAKLQAKLTVQYEKSVPLSGSGLCPLLTSGFVPRWDLRPQTLCHPSDNFWFRPPPLPWDNVIILSVTRLLSPCTSYYCKKT